MGRYFVFFVVLDHVVEVRRLLYGDRDLTPQEVADIAARLDTTDLMVFGGHAGK